MMITRRIPQSQVKNNHSINSKSYKMNIYQSNNRYYFDYLLPGVKKEDIEISIEEQNLRVKNNDVERNIKLPNNLNLTTTCAELDQGILSISIDKIEATKINIQ